MDRLWFITKEVEGEDAVMRSFGVLPMKNVPGVADGIECLQGLNEMISRCSWEGLGEDVS